MVAFNKTSYTVTIETGTNPIEDWQNLQSDIIGVLAALDVQKTGIEMPYYLLNLLRDMQPDVEVAKKMTK